MDPLKSAKLYRQLEAAGLSSDRILGTMRKVLEDLDEDPADFILLAPILLINKSFADHPDQAHGLLVQFGGPAYFLTKQAVIDAAAVAKGEPLIAKN